MISDALIDLSVEEIQEVDGGISSAEVTLVAALCLTTVNPYVGASLAIVAYANTKFCENCIDY